MKKPIVYLAGPLGFSEVGLHFHHEIIIPLLVDIGFSIRDPWALTDPKLIENASRLPLGEKRIQVWKKVNKIIGANNVEAIKESDLILAVLDGTDVDSGTASEIGFAFALQKLILGYRGDFRQCADNEGGIVNIQVEYFIQESQGIIVKDLPSLKNSLVHFRKVFKKK